VSFATALGIAAAIIAGNIGFLAGCWWAARFIRARIAEHLCELNEKWREW